MQKKNTSCKSLTFTYYIIKYVWIEIARAHLEKIHGFYILLWEIYIYREIDIHKQKEIERETRWIESERYMTITRVEREISTERET